MVNEPHPHFLRDDVPMIVTAVGDAASILLFAALGRNSHHETGGGAVAGALGVAAPFLVGWFQDMLFHVFPGTCYSGERHRAGPVSVFIPRREPEVVRSGRAAC
ncbi:MAG TPA: DUF3054 domain-containing protein [Chloroflexota bacterium]